jgi:hypothetical protein
VYAKVCRNRGIVLDEFGSIWNGKPLGWFKGYGFLNHFIEREAPSDASIYPRGTPSKKLQADVARMLHKAFAPRTRVLP